YVESDTLSRLVGHALARPGAGLLGVELAGEDGAVDPASRRADPSLRDLLLRLGDRGDLYLGRDPGKSLQPVDAVSGALMLLPSVLFVRLNGFDEGYRLHAEDLDLCRRVRQAGYEVLVANDLRVTHVRGVSSRRRPFFVEFHKHRGMWRYFRRFEAASVPTWQHPLIWLALWAHFLVAGVRRLVVRCLAVAGLPWLVRWRLPVRGVVPALRVRVSAQVACRALGRCGGLPRWRRCGGPSSG